MHKVRSMMLTSDELRKFAMYTKKSVHAALFGLWSIIPIYNVFVEDGMSAK